MAPCFRGKIQFDKSQKTVIFSKNGIMKKISSEISVQSPDFKVKWGTTDKKNPSFIYLEMGTYITPQKDEESYQEQIKNIEKRGKSIIKNAIVTTDEIKNDFIFVTDIADTRITYGKKSYLTFQIHVGRKIPFGKDFKSMVSYLNDKWGGIYTDMAETIKENGFLCSKTKN